MIEFDVGLDLFPLMAGTLAAVTCGLLGNFLVLRKQSLMGDAISHSVLPGLVIAFLVSATLNPAVMFLGAAIAGVATVVLIEIVKKLGRVESGAAMGVVFSILFALGVLLLEQAAARNVDLDAGCVLYGQLEMLWWNSPPASMQDALQLRTWTGYEIQAASIDPNSGEVLQPAILHMGVPRQVTTLLLVAAFVVAFITVFFKELRIAAFDPALATTLGYNANSLHYALMIAIAAATVASFEAVGSILVIAMLVCPAASARLMTDRLRSQLAWSVVIALCSSVLGYFAATWIPGQFDLDSVNAAGSMTVVAGLIFVMVVFVSPSHGVVAKALRRTALSRRIAYEDLVAALYRANERGAQGLSLSELASLGAGKNLSSAVARSLKSGQVVRIGDQLSLSESGRGVAARLVRKHRLWEDYLVTSAGLAPDHVHEAAEQLEHIEPAPSAGPAQDPHGRPIPSESDSS
jgi:manganese/zinc/iron transport system permease protein